MKLKHLALAALTTLLPAAGQAASDVTLADPQPGGITYRYTVTMGGADTATFSNHVGAWSWEDQSLFNAANGEPPVGWTHTSNWVALNVTQTAVFKVKLERDATVPWPSTGDPGRLASINNMYPSFTLWKNWDNDVAPKAFADANNGGDVTKDFHTYFNRGAVAWAEDLAYQDHYDNSTLETIEREYILTAGQYTIVLGSNATSNDSNRQGYKATFTTTQDLPVVLGSNSYFTLSSIKPLTVPAAKGILANDTGVGPDDVLEIVSQPAKGSVALNADGSFTYTPGPYFGVAGFDSFTYHVLLGGSAGTPSLTTFVSVSTYAAAAGAHVGHLKNEDGGDIAGLVKFDVTRTGAWTGLISFLGRKYPVTGTLALNGELKIKNSTPLDGHFALATHPDGDRHAHIHIHGSDGINHYAAHVKKSPFSVENQPPSTGRHSVALTVNTSSTGAPTAPGAGNLAVTPTGTSVIVARLGDGTVFSCGTAVVVGATGPELPIYAPAYVKPVGSVAGTLTFGASAESNATGSLVAFKPTQVRPATPSPGFTITYDAVTTKTAAVKARR